MFPVSPPGCKAPEVLVEAICPPRRPRPVAFPRRRGELCSVDECSASEGSAELGCDRGATEAGSSDSAAFLLASSWVPSIFKIVDDWSFRGALDPPLVPLYLCLCRGCVLFVWLDGKGTGAVDAIFASLVSGLFVNLLRR